jgi:hypothetical protein
MIDLPYMTQWPKCGGFTQLNKQKWMNCQYFHDTIYLNILTIKNRIGLRPRRFFSIFDLTPTYKKFGGVELCKNALIVKKLYPKKRYYAKLVLIKD